MIADHAAEYFPLLNWQVQRGLDLVVLAGWSLLAGLAGPVVAVMAGVFAEDRSKVLFAVDEYPVGALGSRGSYPSPGVAVRAWGPRRGPDYFQALAGEDLVGYASELSVAVPDDEAE